MLYLPVHQPSTSSENCTMFVKHNFPFSKPYTFCLVTLNFLVDLKFLEWFVNSIKVNFHCIGHHNLGGVCNWLGVNAVNFVLPIILKNVTIKEKPNWLLSTTQNNPKPNGIAKQWAGLDDTSRQMKDVNMCSLASSLIHDQHIRRKRWRNRFKVKK